MGIFCESIANPKGERYNGKNETKGERIAMDIDKMINVSMDVMEAVTDAVNRNDFSGLSSTIQQKIMPGGQQGSWQEFTEAEKRRNEEMRQRQAAQREQQARQAEEARHCRD